jgi:hypothetical protein
MKRMLYILGENPFGSTGKVYEYFFFNHPLRLIASYEDNCIGTNGIMAHFWNILDTDFELIMIQSTLQVLCGLPVKVESQGGQVTNGI